MRVIVPILHHFKMTPDGTVYPYCETDYKFWCRYLDVFDEVVVFCRVKRIGEVEPATMPAKANGPGVTFFALPEFQGLWQCLMAYLKTVALAKQVLSNDDACILRVPAHLSTVLWRKLKKAKRPYGVEAVGDIWQALSPGSYPNVFRPLLRRVLTWEMARQCREACAAAYVTKDILQRRYPPGGWTTHYSSIDLPEETIIDEPMIKERIKRIEVKFQSKAPWRLCFAGSLWHLCKSPDVLIDAITDCIRKGIQVELVMLGDGNLRPRLEEQASRLGIGQYVKFLGQLPPGKLVHEQLDQSDVFILPSRSEGLPRAVIEAMARGLPCIGGSEGGFQELLEPRYMVKPIEAKSLSSTIRAVLSDKEGMNEAVSRNVKKASEYRIEILRKRRIKFYMEVKEATQQWLKQKKC